MLGILSYPAIYETLGHIEYQYDVKLDLPYRFDYGFTKPFKKWCTKDVSKNGHGWVFVRRDYYKCGKIAIKISDLLYGEYTKPRDYKLEKETCKTCKL